MYYKFFDRLYAIKKPVISTVEKKKLFLVLPYLGKFSLQTKDSLTRLFKSKLRQCKINIVFKTQKRLSNFFPFKDKVPTSLVSHNVYFFKCSGCDSCYLYYIKRDKCGLNKNVYSTPLYLF